MANPRSRASISGLFFLHGLVFSSWGVRIPAIQEVHGLSEAALGTVLLTLPIGSLVSMPLAAALTSRFGSKKVLMTAIILYAFLLVGVGYVKTMESFMALLVIFGLISNMVNISLNTQAVGVEKLYGRSIMASLHGLWSLAGFVGGGIGAAMISFEIVPVKHFFVIMLCVISGALICMPNLLPDEPKDHDHVEKLFHFPDRSLFLLGAICFFSLICEGTMFDWSGVYFKKVILAKGGWIGAGYTAFMTTMAGTRFVADRLREKLGTQKILLLSGVLVFSGLLISICFPTLPFAIIGFLLVGSGVSSVVPLVLSQAGKTKTMPAPAAIAAVSTTGYFGFLLGPPLIGWIAGVSSLRVSFLVIAIMGLGIAWLSQKTSKAGHS
jgi:MFS family permease